MQSYVVYVHTVSMRYLIIVTSGKQSHSKRLQQEKFLCRTNERKDLGKTNEDTDGVGATTLVKS